MNLSQLHYDHDRQKSTPGGSTARYTRTLRNKSGDQILTSTHALTMAANATNQPNAAGAEHPNGPNIAYPTPIHPKYLTTPWNLNYALGNWPLQAQPAPFDAAAVPAPALNHHDFRDRRDENTTLAQGIPQHQAFRERDEISGTASPFNDSAFPEFDPIPYEPHLPGNGKNSDVTGQPWDGQEERRLERYFNRNADRDRVDYRFEALRWKEFWHNNRIPCMEGCRRPGTAMNPTEEDGFPTTTPVQNIFQGENNIHLTQVCPNYLAPEETDGANECEIRPCAAGKRCLQFKPETRGVFMSRYDTIIRTISNSEAERFIGHPLAWLPEQGGAKVPVQDEDGDPDIYRRPIGGHQYNPNTGWTLLPAYWVCQSHVAHTRDFWEVDRLLERLRFRTCAYHEIRLKEKFPNGINTCQCEKDLYRWLCKTDMEVAVLRVIQNAIFRLTSRPSGGVAREWFGRGNPESDRWYYKDAERDFMNSDAKHNDLNWADVVYKNHRCGLGCGRRRKRQKQVRDCRSCGGLIVLPSRGLRSFENVPSLLYGPVYGVRKPLGPPEMDATFQYPTPSEPGRRPEKIKNPATMFYQAFRYAAAFTFEIRRTNAVEQARHIRDVLAHALTRTLENLPVKYPRAITFAQAFLHSLANDKNQRQAQAAAESAAALNTFSMQIRALQTAAGITYETLCENSAASFEEALNENLRGMEAIYFQPVWNQGVFNICRDLLQFPIQIRDFWRGWENSGEDVKFQFRPRGQRVSSLPLAAHVYSSRKVEERPRRNPRRRVSRD